MASLRHLRRLINRLQMLGTVMRRSAWLFLEPGELFVMLPTFSCGLVFTKTVPFEGLKVLKWERMGSRFCL